MMLKCFTIVLLFRQRRRCGARLVKQVVGFCSEPASAASLMALSRGNTQTPLIIKIAVIRINLLYRSKHLS